MSPCFLSASDGSIGLLVSPSGIFPESLEVGSWTIKKQIKTYSCCNTIKRVRERVGSCSCYWPGWPNPQMKSVSVQTVRWMTEANWTGFSQFALWGHRCVAISQLLVGASKSSFAPYQPTQDKSFCFEKSYIITPLKTTILHLGKQIYCSLPVFMSSVVHTGNG